MNARNMVASFSQDDIREMLEAIAVKIELGFDDNQEAAHFIDKAISCLDSPRSAKLAAMNEEEMNLVKSNNTVRAVKAYRDRTDNTLGDSLFKISHYKKILTSAGWFLPTKSALG